ncbi:aminopeptidase [Treponema endosymbiont of Eucomonympha sp.]|uniref:aminopeptidase n=1 Tax=Treponema endosymbiont of Eucomonympha sp. TaxID=1580831 RepID=UPI000781972F|nr:aminopeptidase [Treponema endosymbiont of Eucomonympha sp.]
MKTALEQQIRRSAETVVRDVCALKRGERALIVSNRGPVQAVAEALYDASADAGAVPTLILQGEKTLLDNADGAVLEALRSAPDALFSISAQKLGKDPAGTARPYAAPDGKTYTHLFDYLLHGTKTLRAIWTPGITPDIFARTVNINYAELKERCAALRALFRGVRSVRVTSPGGTDISVPVAGRSAFADDGSFALPGTGGNIPAGEVYISPNVGSGEGTGCRGTIVFDGSISLLNGTRIIDTPIAVSVADGFVSAVEGGAEAEALSAALAEAEGAARAKEAAGLLPAGEGARYAKNARHIGELGIGLNPAAAVRGNMLEDEKAFKTCHFAVGSNYDGDADALIHLDGVVLNPTLVFEYGDGRTLTVEKDGALLLPSAENGRR